MGNGDVGLDWKVRARILDGAVEVIASAGYRRTTEKAIADAARVSEPTFREHFSDKEECYLAILDGTIATVEKAVAETVNRQKTWAARTAAATETCLTTLAADPARAHLCLAEPYVVGGAAAARYDSLVCRVAAQLSTGRCLRDCEHDPPRDLELFLVSGLAWIVQGQLDRPRGDGWVAEILPEVLQMLLCPFVGEAEAGRISGLSLLAP